MKRLYLALALVLVAGFGNVIAQETGGASGAMTGGDMTGGVMTGGDMTGGAMTGGADAAPAPFRGANDDLEREVLVEGMNEPMALDIASDGRIFYTERLGNFMLYSEGEGEEIIHIFDVYTEEEHGLMGVALDPDFDSNGHLYLYYTPAEGDGNLLSRFTYSGEAGELSLEEEEVLLEVPSDRETCCHQAGALNFGPDGMLYLSTGDNANPFESDGFAPIDRREGREYFNALRTSSNLGDLRGKILRLNKDGSVPDDNPFVGDDEARPEIYALGFRNPFRFRIDEETGWLLIGNVGPDAEEADPARGPIGLDEWHVITEPGQDAGWPTCIGDNKPYEDWNFATETSEGTFDCSDKTEAVIWYPYGPSEEFPELGQGGRNAQGGPILRNLEGAEHQWSEDYVDKWLIYEWQRNVALLVTLNDNGTEAEAIEPFIDEGLIRPMDALQGPDGALYMLEYGTDWFAPNDDAKLTRITNTQP